MPVWRNDLDSKDPITATMVAIEAVDERVSETRHFSLQINHVRGLNGEGFMPSIMSFLSGELRKNGDVHYGTDQGAYSRAVKEGKVHLSKFQREFDERL